MLKLLIEKERKLLRQEYLKRLTSLFLIITSIVLILFGLTLVPSYLIIKSEHSLLETQLNIVKDPELNKDRIESKREVVEIEGLLRLLDTESYNFPEIVRSITKHQVDEVIISSIDFKSQFEGRGILEIGGISTDREKLAEFVESLKQEEMFEQVTLPFSSFTKKDDSPFSITIALKDVDKK